MKTKEKKVFYLSTLLFTLFTCFKKHKLVNKVPIFKHPGWLPIIILYKYSKLNSQTEILVISTLISDYQCTYLSSALPGIPKILKKLRACLHHLGFPIQNRDGLLIVHHHKGSDHRATNKQLPPLIPHP